jgi:hypothetical protein
MATHRPNNLPPSPRQVGAPARELGIAPAAATARADLVAA